MLGGPDRLVRLVDGERERRNQGVVRLVARQRAQAVVEGLGEIVAAEECQECARQRPEDGRRASLRPRCRARRGSTVHPAPRFGRWRAGRKRWPDRSPPSRTRAPRYPSRRTPRLPGPPNRRPAPGLSASSPRRAFARNEEARRARRRGSEARSNRRATPPPSRSRPRSDCDRRRAHRPARSARLRGRGAPGWRVPATRAWAAGRDPAAAFAGARGRRRRGPSRAASATARRQAPDDREALPAPARSPGPRRPGARGA